MFELLLVVSLMGSLQLAAASTNTTNSTAEQTVGWVSDPNGRGTFTLVLNCLITLSLCVWSAMHLNVPRYGEVEWQSWIRQTEWSLIGIFAPELVVFAAWHQNSSMKRLSTIVMEQGDAAYALSKREEKRRGRTVNADETIWKPIHGFYSSMGGFAFDLETQAIEGEGAFIPDRKRLTLTARGVALLAECGHLPIIAASEIDDKSKADGVAKAVVMVQATWMLIQVLGRAGMHQAVTLLEVNTIGHILCAAGIFVLWWDKPRNIREPTKLKGDWTRPLCAYMYMSSEASGIYSHRKKLLKANSKDPELAKLRYSSASSIEDSDSQESPARGRFEILDTSSNFGTGTETRTEMQAIRYRLAAEAIETYSAIASRFASVQQGHKANSLLVTDSEKGGFDNVPILDEFLVDTVGNWESSGLLRNTGGLVMGMILWFASIAFGAIHAAAWNSYFPSRAEKIMWRFSALYIAGAGLLWLCINFLAQKFPWVDRYWNSVLDMKANRFTYAWLCIVCGICGMAYIFSRGSLVADAFASIRSLPPSAYETPDWTQVFPHL